MSVIFHISMEQFKYKLADLNDFSPTFQKYFVVIAYILQKSDRI